MLPLNEVGSSPLGLGIGIAGMKERVRQLQGRIEIVSQEGKGTGVIVAIPDTLDGGICASTMTGTARSNGGTE